MLHKCTTYASHCVDLYPTVVYSGQEPEGPEIF